jgi:4-diphosphocytidyl-2-C-methyl-D-erythritol kinase
MKIRAYAKINLCLDVLGKDVSGYHKIRTIIYEYRDLFDEIEIKKSARDFVVMTPSYKISARKNLAYRALKLLKEKYGISDCVEIKIKKNIPLAAGLGGGSSDAAAVLKALTKLWKLKISDARLKKLAAELGMDVPFFINGGTALAENFGEKIRQLPSLKLKIKLAKKSGATSAKTKKKYVSLDLSLCGKSFEKTSAALRAIKSGNKKNLLANLHNDFETTSPQRHGRHLSGAGPSTFKMEI